MIHKRVSSVGERAVLRLFRAAFRNNLKVENFRKARPQMGCGPGGKPGRAIELGPGLCYEFQNTTAA